MRSNVPDESSDHAELNEQLERLADPKKRKNIQRNKEKQIQIVLKPFV